MEVIVRYTEETPTSFTEVFLQRVAEETLHRSPLNTFFTNKRVALNVIAVSAEKIQSLNKRYGGKDKVTDILSFGEYRDREALETETAAEVFLGEIFFCQEFIAGSAHEDEVAVEHELIYVFSHGVLHLLGYDHEEAMFTLQDEVTEFLMKPEEAEG